MLLGVVDRHGMIPSPASRMFLFHDSHQSPLDGLPIPRTVLRKAFHVPPLVLHIHSSKDLRNGVFLGVEHRSRDPLHELRPAAQRKNRPKFPQQRLPILPKSFNILHDALLSSI
jgi:hypothetical protein